MSLPLQSKNPPSRSPSKSSLRRTSGTVGSSDRKASLSDPSASPGPTTHFAAETTQHHFLPHSPPNQYLEYNEDDDEQALTYDDDASYQTAPQPPIPFQPFFTLIEDTLTNEHHHPTVHYIFADDEPDIITEAACRSLEQDVADTDEDSAVKQEQAADEGHIESRLPPLRPGVKEHYLILDIHSSAPIAGPAFQQQLSDRLPSPSPSSVETAQALTRAYPYTVASAQSLSADWQVLRTNITDAPTMHPEQNQDEQHLMLRIEGRGNSPDKLLQRRDGETMEDMVERFQARLAEIRRLMADIDVDEGQGHEADTGVQGIFAPSDVEGVGLRHTGFGHAVLDEQD